MKNPSSVIHSRQSFYSYLLRFARPPTLGGQFHPVVSPFGSFMPSDRFSVFGQPERNCSPKIGELRKAVRGMNTQTILLSLCPKASPLLRGRSSIRTARTLKELYNVKKRRGKVVKLKYLSYICHGRSALRPRHIENNVEALCSSCKLKPRKFQS